MFVLPDDRVFLIDISNALDVLWEQYEEAAKRDPSFFSSRYQKAKAKWLEQEVKKCLSKIFPHDCIYINLSYPDPNKDLGIAEIDCIVDWGPFLVLIESKAKQFQVKSQLGNVARLYADIKANITDAFDQVKRAARYIEIVDKAGSNSIKIDSVQNSITIESAMQLKIKSQTIEIESGTMMTIKAGATLTIQGTLVQIN